MLCQQLGPTPNEWRVPTSSGILSDGENDSDPAWDYVTINTKAEKGNDDAEDEADQGEVEVWEADNGVFASSSSSSFASRLGTTR